MSGGRSPALVVRTPGDVALEERDAPVPGPGEVLIRPDVVGLCGTDLELIAGEVDPAYTRYPLVLGHEWSGIVVSADGPGPAPGTRVVAEGVVPCGHCARCRAGETNLCATYDEMGFTRDGAATGYVAVAAPLVHAIGPGVSAEDAALVEPASVVYRALAGSAVAPGCRALVVGDGTVALLAVRLLGLWSPGEIVMLGRRAGQAGLAATAGAARFETAPGAAGTGYDLVIEAAGTTDAVLTALAAARRGGSVVLIGLPPHGDTAAVPVDDLVNNDLTVRGSFSYTSSSWRDVVTLLNSGRLRLDFLVTHRFALADWERALDALRGSESPRGKVMLTIGAPEAARGWAATPAPARAAALSAAAGALAERAGEMTGLVISEVGKPRSEAAGEVARGVAILRYFAQAALLPDGDTLPAASPDALLMARRRPLGVTGLVTPWNFPVAIPLWKAAPSLAFGNAAVLKPSEESSAVALMLAGILAPHLPPDVFQVVLGAGETGRALTGHQDVAAVSFTGSVPAGHDVVARAAGRGARVQAEMGGQNASVVLADADLDRAATAIAYAAMGYAGQKCTATSRIIVADAVYAKFRDQLAAAVAALGVLDPRQDGTLVGPVITERARDAALAAVAASGGTVVAGGTALDAPGFYMAPTLVELDSPEGPLATEEVFAPVAALLRANSAEAAVRIANDVRYGLVTAVFTQDLGQALRLADQFDAGMVRVNAPTSGVDYHAPFGGAKQSSYGPREQGLAARDFYTETRTITIVP